MRPRRREREGGRLAASASGGGGAGAAEAAAPHPRRQRGWERRLPRPFLLLCLLLVVLLLTSMVAEAKRPQPADSISMQLKSRKAAPRGSSGSNSNGKKGKGSKGREGTTAAAARRGAVAATGAGAAAAAAAKAGASNTAASGQQPPDLLGRLTGACVLDLYCLYIYIYVIDHAGGTGHCRAEQQPFAAAQATRYAKSAHTYSTHPFPPTNPPTYTIQTPPNPSSLPRMEEAPRALLRLYSHDEPRASRRVAQTPHHQGKCPARLGGVPRRPLHPSPTHTVLPLPPPPSSSTKKNTQCTHSTSQNT
jgi:hypothetical protein